VTLFLIRNSSCWDRGAAPCTPTALTTNPSS